MVSNRPTTSSMLSRSLGHSNGRPSSLPVKAKSSTSATTSTVPAKRRGFGLFSDDEEEGEPMGDESKKLSVSFSGNKSGFEKIEKVKGKGRMSLDGTDSNSSQSLSASFPVYTPQNVSGSRNSRNSTFISSKRSGRAPRSTPYSHSTTTSRALQRAKAASQSNGSVDNHEAQLISDTSYEEPSDKRSPYTMHGAKDYDDEDEVPTDEDPVDVDLERPANEYSFTITPSRNLFAKTPSPVKKTPTRSPKGAPSTPATGKKTWGQWLGAILPESVKKPVKAILGAPDDDPYDMEAKVITPTKDLVIGTPRKDNADDENDDVYSLPGSFGKPEPKRPSPSSMTTSLLDYQSNSKSNDHYDSREVSRSFGGTPSRVNDSGLFVYDKPKVTTSTAPSRRERRSTMSTPLKHSKPTIEVSSLRKPNNFIERMRSAKRTPRYDPYARKSAGTAPPKEKARLTQEEETELTPEEKLELLKQRQKERKIAELEDKYEMREALKALGQPIPDDDEVMPDSDTEAPKDKGKGKEKENRRASLNATVEEIAEEASTTPSSPGSPPKTSPVKRTRESPTAGPSRNLFTPSKPAPSFLLNPEVKPGDIPFKINTAPPPTDAPTINFNAAPAWSFASDTSDKENISDGPPPPPTMSHATLPAPLTASASPPVLSGGLFGSQPAGGFGLGTSPSKETPLTPFQRQKNAAERFKPTAPSSLRESRCADEDEKENVPDKENAGEGSSGGKGEKKGLSQQQGQSSGSGVFAKAALKENAGVLNMGKSDVKIDVRAQVEGIPIKQLSSVMVWPVDSSFGSQAMKDAVANMWTGKLSEYPAGFGELFAQSVRY